MKKRLSDDTRAALVKVAGIALAIFAVFTFIAILSYLIHWRADMSGEEL